MRIEIHLLSQSQPMEYANVKNAYTKDGMYCILLRDGSVTKFPMVNIFRVKESEDVDVELEATNDMVDEVLNADIEHLLPAHFSNKTINFVSGNEFDRISAKISGGKPNYESRGYNTITLNGMIFKRLSD